MKLSFSSIVASILMGISGLFGNKQPNLIATPKNIVAPTPIPNPLSIMAMRQKEYPGSEISITETLPPGSNYQRYVASYQSEGLKIFGLLTVPNGKKPERGWPIIVFNHGYIPPDVYKTTERYVAYTDAFSRNGYIVFKPDYRGNGSSEGNPEGAYYSPAYSVDVLNAIASIKKYKDANPAKLGIWGHSMGGNIALRNVVIDPTGIQAAVIWGGVVGSYDDLLNNWHRRTPFQLSERERLTRGRASGRQQLIDRFGMPKDNPEFWNSIDPTAYVTEIQTPISLHHGEKDEEVPYAFSQGLYDKLKSSGKTVELFLYSGADHDISGSSFGLAMERSVAFFDRYLK